MIFIAYLILNYTEGAYLPLCYVGIRLLCFVDIWYHYFFKWNDKYVLSNSKYHILLPFRVWYFYWELQCIKKLYYGTQKYTVEFQEKEIFKKSFLDKYLELPGKVLKALKNEQK